jgi:hypothetical protein
MNKEKVEDDAVKELLKMGLFKQKFCNNAKSNCENEKCVIRSRRRTANA